MEGPDRLRVSWSLPSTPGPLVGDGFLLRLWDGARGQERRENISSPQARTALLTRLTPGIHYQLDVRLYHCTLLGPASPPTRVLLPLSGMLEKGGGLGMRGGQGTQGIHETQKGMGGYRRLDGCEETQGTWKTWAWEDLGCQADVTQGGRGTEGTQGTGQHGEDLGHWEDLEHQEDLGYKENKGQEKLKGEGDRKEFSPRGKKEVGEVAPILGSSGGHH